MGMIRVYSLNAGANSAGPNVPGRKDSESSKISFNFPGARRFSENSP